MFFFAKNKIKCSNKTLHYPNALQTSPVNRWEFPQTRQVFRVDVTSAFFLWEEPVRQALYKDRFILSRGREGSPSTPGRQPQHTQHQVSQPVDVLKVRPDSATTVSS